MNSRRDIVTKKVNRELSEAEKKRKRHREDEDEDAGTTKRVKLTEIYTTSSNDINAPPHPFPLAQLTIDKIHLRKRTLT
jgi:hypothetical protein